MSRALSAPRAKRWVVSWMCGVYEHLFAYLEADLVGAQPPAPAQACELAEPARLLYRVAELVNADWSEEEAATELGPLAGEDCLRAAYGLLLSSLVRNPLVDVRGIRMARIVLAALDGHRRARASGLQRLGVVGEVADPSRPRLWWRRRT